MSEAIDHLAELTGFRDRDVLDVTLVGAFRDLLQPDCVAIYRPVGDNASQHWLTRARLLRHESAPRADSMWSKLDELPPLDALPHHRSCLATEAPIAVADGNSTVHLFPLTTDREVNGVLEVRHGVPLSDEQVRLVRSILRVYRNFQGLLDYSERDTLTGLLNRKTFDGSFLGVSAQAGAVVGLPCRADRDGRRGEAHGSSWLGVVDIDHFKSVNDGHGHLIGDEVLLLVARLMRTSFRYQDQLYRFGGEEFVVLMRGGHAAQATQAFERLRSNVEAYVFPRVGHITVSVGFTRVRPGDTPSGAFERADQAVYFAKQNGRNQVAHHGELIERGLLVDATRVGDMELF